RLIGLVENLLDISRIEAGRQKFEWADTHLEDMASTVVEELTKAAKDKGLKLIYHKPKKPLPAVYADKNKIHEVMMNFTDNAIKYTKTGDVEVSIEEAPKGSITFAVKDHGMGVAEETLPYLFKKFSRGKDSFKVHTEGTGLGLYVARMIIEAHHGILGAETAGINKGSRFFFTIPLAGPKTTNYTAGEPASKFLKGEEKPKKSK
ncbi:MAG: HAMP domain-containing histidine kinase, partial [Candidatus Buchananbacteria bacterium]|nr:HAMP domain-containing histidine kinase [Candidatus Buchananbacteria bacterium]